MSIMNSIVKGGRGGCRESHWSLQAHSCGLFSEASQRSNMPIITTTIWQNPVTRLPDQTAQCHPSLLQRPQHSLPVSQSPALYRPQVPILPTLLNKSVLHISVSSAAKKHTPVHKVTLSASGQKEKRLWKNTFKKKETQHIFYFFQKILGIIILFFYYLR